MSDQGGNDADDGEQIDAIGNGLDQEVIQTLEPFVEPARVKEAASVVKAMLIQQSHSGPLPSSHEFRGYNDVVPGAADRLLRMAEKEQSHRQALENKVVAGELKLKSRGQQFALASLIVMLVVIALIAYWGHAVAATTIGTSVVVGVVALFLQQHGKRAENSAPAPGEK